MCPNTCSQQSLRFESQDVVKEEKKSFDRNDEKEQKTFCSPSCVPTSHIGALCWPHLLELLQDQGSRNSPLFCLCRMLCASASSPQLVLARCHYGDDKIIQTAALEGKGEAVP